MFLQNYTVVDKPLTYFHLTYLHLTSFPASIISSFSSLKYMPDIYHVFLSHRELLAVICPSISLTNSAMGLLREDYTQTYLNRWLLL